MNLVVTGASKGLGLWICKHALSLRTSRDGVPDDTIQKSMFDIVIGVGRSDRESVDIDKNLSSRFVYVQGDVRDEATINRVLTILDGKPLHGLINNAGVLEPIGEFEKVDGKRAKECFDINFFAVFCWCQRLMPSLEKCHEQAGMKARILNVSSGAATKAYRGWSVYCASKAALNMLTQSMAYEHPSVISLAIRPGVVDTEMQQLIRERGEDAMKSDHAKFINLWEKGELLHPRVPAELMIDLIVKPVLEEGVSGRFVALDDIKTLFQK